MKDKKYRFKIKNILKTNFLIFGLCFWFFVFNFSFSNAQYNLIEPLPDIQSTTGFPDFVSRFIPFLLAFAALAAFVQIVFGGIQRATSGGNPSAIKDANERIGQAILGLVLAFSAWLILNTINPDLVSFKFFVQKIETSPTTQTPEQAVEECKTKKCRSTETCTVINNKATCINVPLQ